jgi:branched-chain amino acid transport system permease protein
MRVLRAVWPMLPPAALILVLALVGSGLGPASQLDVTTGLVYLCMVIALYAFVGLSGVFSFGHIAFVAIGAYASGLLAVPVLTKQVLYTDLPGVLAKTEFAPVLAVLGGGVIAALASLLLAPAFRRLSGLSASLATFAALVIVNEVARNWEAVTRGTKGLLSVPTETTLSVALVWALIFLVVAYVFQTSRLGLQLRASREDPIAAEAIGVHVGRLRGVALTVSAFLAGTAGGLYGQLLGSFNPDVFYLDLTFLTIAMLVVGGVKSLSGAVVGAITITVLTQLLRELESAIERPGVTEVGFALVAIVILLVRPSGLTGGREAPLPRFLRSR